MRWDEKTTKNSPKLRVDRGSMNCTHGDERARNVHVKRLSRARSYIT